MAEGLPGCVAGIYQYVFRIICAYTYIYTLVYIFVVYVDTRMSRMTCWVCGLDVWQELVLVVHHIRMTCWVHIQIVCILCVYESVLVVHHIRMTCLVCGLGVWQELVLVVHHIWMTCWVHIQIICILWGGYGQ